MRISSPAAAQSLGIGLVHQEIALCPDATVAENMFMAATNRRRAPFMNYRALERDAQAVMDRLAAIDVRRKVADLPISSQQLVEIAKALTLDCRVLILDEPTAALTETETRQLFAIIRDLKANGISIIYISHRMGRFSACATGLPCSATAATCVPTTSPTSRQTTWCAAWWGARSRSSIRTSSVRTTRPGRRSSRPTISVTASGSMM
ncbi:hypothetical protein AJ87_39665 [Rhizobium yanglingense]|nr:hypothetical protein AJ87_39665 [Rhizobium yanglingense]